MPKINRRPVDFKPFQMREDDVKWPTLKGAYLKDDGCVERVQKLVEGRGQSIIYLHGEYGTNLNGVQRLEEGSMEQAVFFEYLLQSSKFGLKREGGIFLLCWIGDYRYGSIYHSAWQFPQVLSWAEDERIGWDNMIYQSWLVYRRVACAMYDVKEATNIPEPDVREFCCQLYQNPLSRRFK